LKNNKANGMSVWGNPTSTRAPAKPKPWSRPNVKATIQGYREESDGWREASDEWPVPLVIGHRPLATGPLPLRISDATKTRLKAITASTGASHYAKLKTGRR
jgi:hypothetical protein